jgi:hypothetical protein
MAPGLHPAQAVGQPRAVAAAVDQRQVSDAQLAVGKAHVELQLPHALAGQLHFEWCMRVAPGAREREPRRPMVAVVRALELQVVQRELRRRRVDRGEQ